MSQKVDIAKPLILNALVGLGYYAACSYSSLLPKEALRSQIALFSLSAIVYNVLQSAKDTKEKTLSAIDIIPIAMILLFKHKDTSWKTHIVCTAILSSSQIGISKASSVAPSVAPPIPKKSCWKTQWITNHDMMYYSQHILPNSKTQMICPSYPYTPAPLDLENLATELNEFISIHLEAKSKTTTLFIPLHVSRNHWTLIYINFDTRVVEYYDSKKNYGPHQAITKKLEELTQMLDQSHPVDGRPLQFKSKITKALQPDSYQCGVWVLYFIEKLLENPNVDFNALDTTAAQTMIANYRIAIIPYLEKERWT